MKPERLAHLRTLCSAATPGPWVIQDYDDGSAAYLHSRGLPQMPCLGRVDHQDATFIAEARTALPEALDAIEELEGRVRELEGTVSNQCRIIEERCYICGSYECGGH